MKAAAGVLALIVAAIWATVRGVQWAMFQALRIAVLGVVLWWVGLAVREMVK